MVDSAKGVGPTQVTAPLKTSKKTSNAPSSGATGGAAPQDQVSVSNEVQRVAADEQAGQTARDVRDTLVQNPDVVLGKAQG